MKRLTRVAIATTATALLATGATVPAHAITNTMNDGRCTITVTSKELLDSFSPQYLDEVEQATGERLTEKELGLLFPYDTETLTPQEAKEALESDEPLPVEFFQELAAESEENRQAATSEEDKLLYGLEKQLYETLLPKAQQLEAAVRACAAGEEYDSNSLKAKADAASSDMDDKTKTGLIIGGSIAGALVLIAALIPLLKNILPASIQAMLPF